ncbi:MAG: NUDIX domain-containing protein [Ilumatobacteraceae bacterium]
MGEHVTFRAGVVGVIRRSDGRVLLFERVDVPGSWQFPQGGMDPGETAADAVWREVEEETGLHRAQLRPVDAYPHWVAYELPAEHRRKKTGLGQCQRWYLFEVVDDDVRPTPDQREFRAWRWATIDETLAGVVAFRRDGYERVLSAWFPVSEST